MCLILYNSQYTTCEELSIWRMPHSSLVMILSADTNRDIGIQLQHGSSDVGCQGHIVTHSSLMELEYTQIKVMLFNLLLTLSHNTLFTIHVVVCRTGTDFLWGRVGAIYFLNF